MKLFRTDTRKRRPDWLIVRDRYAYQSRYVKFDIKEGDRVLDIGSGADPFPYATLCVERYIEDTKHRQYSVNLSKPIVVADVHDLPFKDKSFDFVYCCHVLEHVSNPIQACQEIMRVGTRGYIETPTFGKDALWLSARDVHKWHVVGINNTLCFFEYSSRQREGIRSPAWNDLILSEWYHPLQEAYYNSQDIWNVMFLWHDSFKVHVFRLNGEHEYI